LLWYRLAAHLKVGTVRELQARMGSDEFTYWMAFERLEPFGALADESRMGTVAAAIFNSQRTSKTDPYVTPGQLMPALGSALARTRRPAAEDKLTPDQHAALLDADIFGMTQQ
jgi:hypothetical protein